MKTQPTKDSISLDEIRDILELALDEEVDVHDGSQHLYDDLNLDSLAAVSMVVEVQKRFGVRIPDDRVSTVLTVDDLRRIVADLQAASGSAADAA